MATHALPFSEHLALDSSRLATASPTRTVETDTDVFIDHVPDQPNIPLQRQHVEAFLNTELVTKTLDEMYPYLWLVTTPSGTHIDPLHRNAVKDRAVVAAEDPALHLVWHKDKIFVKPMPRALLNADFWKLFLSVPSVDEMAKGQHGQPAIKSSLLAPTFDSRIALGFMRSYALLIKSPIDLAIAIKSGLLPDKIDWQNWERFAKPFRVLEDVDVAQRYHYGQLRLSRLNILVRVLRPRTMRSHRHYLEMYTHTASYLERFFPTLLFMFASVSLVLSAMQVDASMPPDQMFESEFSIPVHVLRGTFLGFTIVVMLTLVLSWVLLLGGPIVYTAAQLLYGWKMQRRRSSRHGSSHLKPEAGQDSSNSC